MKTNYSNCNRWRCVDIWDAESEPMGGSEGDGCQATPGESADQQPSSQRWASLSDSKAVFRLSQSWLKPPVFSLREGTFEQLLTEVSSGG